MGSRPGTAALVATRPVPILSEAAVVLAGAARAPLARTAAACGLANVGLAAVYAGLGSAAHGAFALPLGLAGALGVPALALAASGAPLPLAGRSPAQRNRRTEGHVIRLRPQPMDTLAEV